MSLDIRLPFQLAAAAALGLLLMGVT